LATAICITLSACSGGGAEPAAAEASASGAAQLPSSSPTPCTAPPGCTVAAKPTGFFAMTGLATSNQNKAQLLDLPYVVGPAKFRFRFLRDYTKAVAA
jgi:hypothetical protein